MAGTLSPLLVITDRRACGGRPLVTVIAAALRGGARFVQLREKDLDGGPLLALAEEMSTLTRRFGAKLVINDRIDLALAAGADGVVLPADSFPTAAARALLGPARLLGRSAHSPAEVERAAREGCDFAIFGPVFETPSKTAFGSPQGLGKLAEAARAAIPVYAVGGITGGNARQARAAGAQGIAVIRAVMEASDPAAAARDLLEAQRPG